MIRDDLSNIYNQYQEFQTNAQQFTFFTEYRSRLKKQIDRYKQLLTDQQSQIQTIKAEQATICQEQQQYVPKQQKQNQIIKFTDSNSKDINNDNLNIKKKQKKKEKFQKKQESIQKKGIECMKQQLQKQKQQYNISYPKRKKSFDQQETQKISIEQLLQLEKQKENSSSKANDGIYDFGDFYIIIEQKQQMVEEQSQILEKQQKKKVNKEEQIQKSKKTAQIVQMLPQFPQEKKITNQYGESIYNKQIIDNKQTEKISKQQQTKQCKKKISEKQVDHQIIEIVIDDDDDKKQKSHSQVNKKKQKSVVNEYNDDIEQIGESIDEPNIPKKPVAQNNPIAQQEKISLQNSSTILYEYKNQQQSLNIQQIQQENVPNKPEIHSLFKEIKQTTEEKQEHNFQEKQQINKFQSGNISKEKNAFFKQENATRVSPKKQLDKNIYYQNHHNNINQEFINSFSDQNFQKTYNQNIKQRQQVHQIQQIQQVQEVQNFQQVQQVQQVNKIHSLFQMQEQTDTYQNLTQKGQQNESKKSLNHIQTQLQNIENSFHQEKCQPNQEEQVIEQQNQSSQIDAGCQQQDNYKKVNHINQEGLKTTNEKLQQIQDNDKEKFFINKNLYSNTDANKIENKNSYQIHSLFQNVCNNSQLVASNNKQIITSNNTSTCTFNAIQIMEQNQQEQTFNIQNIEVIEVNQIFSQHQNVEFTEEVNRPKLPYITKNVEIQIQEEKTPLIITPQQPQKIGFIKMIPLPQQDDQEESIEITIEVDDEEKQIQDKNQETHQKISLFKIEEKYNEGTSIITYFLSKSKNSKNKIIFVRYASKFVII